MELRRPRSRAIRWNLRNQPLAGWPQLPGICRADGRYRLSLAGKPRHGYALPQPNDGRRLASAASMRRTYAEHRFHRAHASGKLNRRRRKQHFSEDFRSVQKHIAVAAFKRGKA
jgi:hypothetical protein